MQRVNEFNFYELAKSIHPLLQLTDKSTFILEWGTLWDARVAINSIFAVRPLNVCARAASDLQNAINAAVPENWDDLTAQLSRSNATTTFSPWQVATIQRAAREFETVLAAECQVLDTYFVSKKGAFSTADLVDNAHHHIPPSIREQLPELTKGDIDQAGKCIAFDLPTAAAFHLLRGTEAVLREYYDRIVPGPKKAAPKMRNWGVYIKLLKEHGADTRITSLLDHLRDSYRNPVLHPEENYTDERAQVLFGVCISAIVMMTEAVAALDSKGALLPLDMAPPALTA